MGKKEVAIEALGALVGEIGGSKPHPFQESNPESATSKDSTEAGKADAVVIDAGEGSAGKRGRPRGTVKDTRERRAVSCKMLEEHYRKVGIIAGFAGCSRQDIMDEAYERIIASFERENGPIGEDDARPYGKFNVKF